MAEVIRMNENTWRFEDGFVRFFLLAGSEKAALIDSGVNCPEARELAEGLVDVPVFLLNTHGDGDHVSGTGAFDEIFMHEADYTGCGVAVRFPQTKLHAVHDGEVIDLGGRTLKILEIAGHTKGSIAILDVENRVLYGGDSVQTGNIFLFGGHRDPESFALALRKLIAFGAEYDTVMASHEEPEVPADHVGKVLNDWRRVRAGEIESEIIDVHGNQVRWFRGEACGFFCEA